MKNKDVQHQPAFRPIFRLILGTYLKILIQVPDLLLAVVYYSFYKYFFMSFLKIA